MTRIIVEKMNNLLNITKMRKYIFSFLFLTIFLGCKKNTFIENTEAYQIKDAIWQDFRHQFPFHFQTIGITEAQKDGSYVMVISEPPPM